MKRMKRTKRTPRLDKMTNKILKEILANGERMQTDHARYDYGAIFTLEDVQTVLHQRQDKAREKELARMEIRERLTTCASCGIAKTPHNTGMQGTSMRPTCRACTALKRREERQANQNTRMMSDDELPF